MNMNDPIATLLGNWAIELNIYSILLRVAISVVFAAIIGCERASKRHAAGQRTFILVSLASTMAMMLDKSFSPSTLKSFPLRRSSPSPSSAATPSFTAPRTRLRV